MAELIDEQKRELPMKVEITVEDIEREIVKYVQSLENPGIKREEEIWSS